jgi:predicted MFS family arabinose efflux permease
LWRIALSTVLIMFVTSGLIVHQIPILTDAGISPVDAAWLASLAGIAGVVSKITTGVLLDSYRPNWVASITLIVTSLAFILLLDDMRSTFLILIAIIINGYSMGAKLQITSYLTARYAGMKNFGKIYGFMTSMVALGTGIGPLTAGILFDTQGSYSLFLIFGAIGCIFSGLLLIGLPAYPKWEASAT